MKIELRFNEVMFRWPGVWHRFGIYFHSLFARFRYENDYQYIGLVRRRALILGFFTLYWLRFRKDRRR